MASVQLHTLLVSTVCHAKRIKQLAHLTGCRPATWSRPHIDLLVAQDQPTPLSQAAFLLIQFDYVNICKSTNQLLSLFLRILFFSIGDFIVIILQKHKNKIIIIDCQIFQHVLRLSLHLKKGSGFLATEPPVFVFSARHHRLRHFSFVRASIAQLRTHTHSARIDLRVVQIWVWKIFRSRNKCLSTGSRPDTYFEFDFISPNSGTHNGLMACNLCLSFNLHLILIKNEDYFE